RLRMHQPARGDADEGAKRLRRFPIRRTRVELNPRQEFARLAMRIILCRSRSRGVNRRVLSALAFRIDFGGTVSFTIGEIGKVAHIAPRLVEGALRRLEELGDIAPVSDPAAPPERRTYRFLKLLEE
ncbi:MAG: hypothetical protein U1A16_04185, partial [Patescibacteria group bacterium]|nr:hypothetical protein [Patescibacteria group bacterium]